MRLSVSGIWAVALAAIATLGLAPVAANARPSICIKLERQLASAGGQRAGGAKFQNAARAQAQQLQIARVQSRRAGCGGSLLIFGSSSGNVEACQRINGTIRKMESNLAKLQNKSNSNGSSEVSKSRILAALDANDCYSQVESVSAKRKLPSAAKQDQPGQMSLIFGGEVVERDLDEKTASANILKLSTKKRIKVINGIDSSIQEYDVGGTYRTLCVRTCDGYYFPVSFSTTSSRFSTDEKSCSAMCPGAETKLYYHSIPDQEPEEMISLAKEPYMNLPTAFQYRVKGIAATPGCTCQAQKEASADIDDTAGGPADIVRWIPTPASKPSVLEDAETALNRAGNLDAAAMGNLIEAKAAGASAEPGRKIRVVGPTFLPAQSKAEVLPVPGRVTVQ